ncbi:MAG TPA: four helix bundle protein [Pyrinomonadaceae bacterium]|nr:four helix bundle protein [Pyrinomonadaceae bacterium]
MRPHEKLDVWKKAIEMVTLVYEITKQFPADERFGLTSQIRRAAVSIPANIAEGAARQTDKEFCQFLAISQGSSSELETELLIAKNLGYIQSDDYEHIYQEINTIARMLVGLSKTVRARLT